MCKVREVSFAQHGAQFLNKLNLQSLFLYCSFDRCLLRGQTTIGQAMTTAMNGQSVGGVSWDGIEGGGGSENISPQKSYFAVVFLFRCRGNFT